MDLIVKVYDGSKYEPESKVVNKVEYNNVKSIQVQTIEDAEIFKMGFDDVDPYQEYLILTFDNGETSTFRNSLVDVFRK